MTRSAESLHLAAVELANRGRWTQADRLLALAAERTDDPDLLARVQGTRAIGRAHRGALAEAEDACAAALATRGIGRGTAALLAGQMGSIMELAGRLAEADRWLSRAIDEIEDPVARANLLMNRSRIGMRRRRLDDAARDTAAAVAAYAANGRAIDEAEARHNLGYIDLLRGDLVSALTEMWSARATLADVSDMHAAVGDVDRAEVLRDAGLTGEAERILSASAAVFGRLRMPQMRAETEFALARSQLTHDPAAAARTAGVAARRFRALGNQTSAARASAVRVRALLARDVYDGRGDLVRTATRTPKPAEIESVALALQTAGLRAEAESVRLVGELAATRERRVERRRAVRTPAGAPIDVRLLAEEVRVARATSAGRGSVVRRHAAAGLDALARWQASFGSLDLQASIAMHAVPLLTAGLTSAVRTGRPDLVFEWSERARHPSLQVVPLRPPPDGETAAALAELRALRAEDPGSAWLDSPRAAELHDRVREHQWSSTGAARVEERARLAEVQEELDADTAVLAFVWSNGVLECLAVTSTDARIVPLPEWPTVRGTLKGLRADLDMSASVRGSGLAGVIRRALGARLAVLSAALLEAPLAAAGDVRRLVLTVPGVLSGIPWAMLPAMQGRSFTLAPSATRWLRGHGDATGPARSAGFAAGPRVPRGSEEIDTAAAAWRDATALRGPEASVDNVVRLAHDVDVLHVAAHGRHTADNPLFSGLELADGTLFGYDIDLVPTVPSTIVLSSCEVGRSSVRWGEEAVGMTRVWLHAGTRCVIASPVVVADDDACELLGAVHAGLARGAQPADALADAAAQTGIVTPFQAHGAGL